MKKLFLSSAFLLMGFTGLFAQEYTVVTTIESIIPAGLGRSRMIEHKQEMEIDKFTTERTSGTDSYQGSVKRKDIKIDNLTETKMLNFFSPIGINFQNIASNDALVKSEAKRS